MGLGQFLNVIRPGHHRVLEDLNGTDLQHVQDDRRILRIVFVSAVMQRLACAGQSDRGHKLQVKSGDAQMIHQRPMIVASRFKADPDGQAVFSQDRDELPEIVCAVGDRQAPATRFALDGNQHLVQVFRDVDAYQNTGV